MRITPWLHGLDADSLARLLALRPDVCRHRPGSVPALARRLSTADSVAAAVARLDRDCLVVAQSVVVLGDGTDVARLRELVRGPDDALDSALQRLRERALVWPGARPGTLRFTVALGRHWQHPLDLGPPAEQVLDRATKDPLREMAQRLGAPKGNTRDDALRNVVRAVSDAGLVRERAASASPEARNLLEELAWRPHAVEPPRHTWNGDYYSRRPDDVRLPAEELYDLGLLLAASSEYGCGVLPREAAQALRGPERGPDVTGAPVVSCLPIDVSGAGTVALGSIDEVRRVLDTVASDPLVPLKTGGVGQREVQRVARACRLPVDRIRLWLETAVRAGLLGPGGDGHYRPTFAVPKWRTLEAAEQWASLIAAWWRSTEPGSGEQFAASMLDSLAGAEAGDVRRAVIDVLAGQAPGRGADGLGAAVAWRVPAHADAGHRAEEVLAQADALGVTAAGGLTPVGRALVSRPGTVHEALRAQAASCLPSSASTVALQSDLTAVASGAVPAATAAVLDLAADREGVGVWRFSRASVRRALDAGQTGTALELALIGIATTPVPQVLVQLVRDVARVHGNLRIIGCGSCLVAADEALLKEVLSERLELHEVAPTVAVFPGSPTELVDTLRRLGYAPVVDPLSGTARIDRAGRSASARGRASSSRRAGPSAGGSSTEAPDIGASLIDSLGPEAELPDPQVVAAQLRRGPADLDDRIEAAVELLLHRDEGIAFSPVPRDQLRSLARAQEEGSAVLVEYNRSLTSRASGLYLFDDVCLEPGVIRAWDPDWESPGAFRLYGVVSVEPT